MGSIAHPLLKASGMGSIVFISFVAGFVAICSGTVYAASKAAINQLTKNLACEWAKDNIRTNCVTPWQLKGKAHPSFLKDRRAMKREYEEFKVRVNGLVAKAQKIPDEGWIMQDGTPWPGKYTRDHPGMIQTAKEGIKQQDSNSEISGKMQAVFIEMDKSPTTNSVVKELKDLKEVVIGGGREDAKDAFGSGREASQGAAVYNFVIQLALSMVAGESIKIYNAISDGTLNLVDKFFEMQRHHAIKALEIYRKAGQQTSPGFYQQEKRRSAWRFTQASFKHSFKSRQSLKPHHFDEVLPLRPCLETMDSCLTSEKGFPLIRSLCCLDSKEKGAFHHVVITLFHKIGFLAQETR